MPLFVSEEIKNIIDEETVLSNKKPVNNSLKLMQLIIHLENDNFIEVPVQNINFASKDKLSLKLLTNLNVSKNILSDNKITLLIGDIVFDVFEHKIKKIKYVSAKDEYLINMIVKKEKKDV